MKMLDEYRPEDVVKYATYLREAGMPAEVFASLHHYALKEKSETYANVLRHFGSTGSIRSETNRRFAARLDFMAAGNRAGQNWAALRKDALKRFPLCVSLPIPE